MRIVTVVLLGVLGCGGKKQAEPVAETGSGSAPAVPPPPLDAAPPLLDAASSPPADAAMPIAGFYKGQWGQLVLREKDGQLLAVYSHDKGTISGTRKGDTFVGWWCEAPSRKPPKDAGEVELTFIMRPTGLVIDGRWRYGTEDKWRDDWDIERVDQEPPPDLVKRFDDATAFCAHP